MSACSAIVGSTFATKTSVIATWEPSTLSDFAQRNFQDEKDLRTTCAVQAIRQLRILLTPPPINTAPSPSPNPKYRGTAKS